MNNLNNKKDIKAELDFLGQFKLPEKLKEIYLSTLPLSMIWKNKHGQYQGFCHSATLLYDSTPDEMYGKDECHQRDIVPLEVRKFFLKEDQYVFDHGENYIAFASLNYADAWRHVFYTKEKFFDEVTQEHFVVGVLMEMPSYLMKFLFKSGPVKMPEDLKKYEGIYFSNINIRAKSAGINLSSREEECLVLMIRGASANEIGIKLGLSKRTVEFHTESLKSKFNFFKKSELISQAIDLGYLSTLPGIFFDF